MTSSNLKILIDIYKAIGGIVSEQGFEALDHFYPGGGEKMDRDFQKILKAEGVVMADG